PSVRRQEGGAGLGLPGVLRGGPDQTDGFPERGGGIGEAGGGGIAPIREAGEEEVEAPLAVGLAPDLRAQPGLDARLDGARDAGPSGNRPVVREKPWPPF